MNRLIVIVIAVLVLAAPARAQEPAPEVSIGIGPVAFGHGRAKPIVAARASIPMGRGLLVDAGISAIPGSGSNSTLSSSGDTVDYLLPDLGLNLELGSGPFRPYVGAGATLALDLRKEVQGDFGVHADAGARIDLSPRWGLRIDGRVRSLGAAYETSREITIAATWHPGTRDW
jgi:hypothetical protein